jgi:hypothetical protein
MWPINYDLGVFGYTWLAKQIRMRVFQHTPLPNEKKVGKVGVWDSIVVRRVSDER